MSREVKRVALDFDWPLGKIWFGYLYTLPCDIVESCEECREFIKFQGWNLPESSCPRPQCLEPPKGDGFQLWENVTEGSPISPVFKSLEELAEWCEKNSTTFGFFKATKDKWLKMLRKDDVKHEKKMGNVCITFK